MFSKTLLISHWLGSASVLLQECSLCVTKYPSMGRREWSFPTKDSMEKFCVGGMLEDRKGFELHVSRKDPSKDLLSDS